MVDIHPHPILDFASSSCCSGFIISESIDLLVLVRIVQDLQLANAFESVAPLSFALVAPLSFALVAPLSSAFAADAYAGCYDASVALLSSALAALLSSALAALAAFAETLLSSALAALAALVAVPLSSALSSCTAHLGNRTGHPRRGATLEIRFCHLVQFYKSPSLHSWLPCF